jgi:hypothetical protein
MQRGKVPSFQASNLPSPPLFEDEDSLPDVALTSWPAISAYQRSRDDEFEDDSKVARGDCDLWWEFLNRLAAVPGIATPGVHWDSRRYLVAVHGVARVRARSRSFVWL